MHEVASLTFCGKESYKLSKMKGRRKSLKTKEPVLYS